MLLFNPTPTTVDWESQTLFIDRQAFGDRTEIGSEMLGIETYITHDLWKKGARRKYFGDKSKWI